MLRALLSSHRHPSSDLGKRRKSDGHPDQQQKQQQQAKKLPAKKKVFDPYDESLEHVVGGGIFVMRLISTKEEHVARLQQQQQAEAAAGGRHPHRPGSALGRQRPGLEVMNDEDTTNQQASSGRPQQQSARVRRAEEERQKSLQRRWLSTGSHVDLSQKAAGGNTAGGGANNAGGGAPRPPSAGKKSSKKKSERSEEEIARFFRSLNDRTQEQLKRHEEKRMKCLNPPVEPQAFGSREDQDASVARLYFDSLQHLEQTREELAERFSPANLYGAKTVVVQSAVIGEAVERLYAGLRPPSPSRDAARAARDSPSRSSSGGGARSKSGGSSRPGSAKKGRGKAKEFKPKKITPQEEKDAVQRLYYLSLEFRKRREKELVDKHLFQGAEIKRVDTAALVSRLYKVAPPPSSPTASPQKA